VATVSTAPAARPATSPFPPVPASPVPPRSPTVQLAPLTTPEEPLASPAWKSSTLLMVLLAPLVHQLTLIATSATTRLDALNVSSATMSIATIPALLNLPALCPTVWSATTLTAQSV
jgi:hypothetical protein